MIDPSSSAVVGQVGLIARLKRVRPQYLGQTVLVVHAVGPLTTLNASGRRFHAWEVRVLAGPVDPRGMRRQHLVVADACLEPIRCLDPGLALMLDEAASWVDADRTLNALKEELGNRGLKEAQAYELLRRDLMRRAIERGAEVVAVPRALLELDFRPIDDTADPVEGPLHWSAVNADQELVITAVCDGFGGWCLLGHFAGNGRARQVETALPGRASRGDVGKAVLGLWKAVFGLRVPAPGTLRDAKANCDRQRFMALLLKTPTLHADGAVLRQITRWLRDCFAGDAGSIEPTAVRPLTLSWHQGLLQLTVDEVSYGCPAYGQWVDDCQVPFDAWLALPMSELRRPVVALTQQAGALNVGRFQLKSSPRTDACGGN